MFWCVVGKMHWQRQWSILHVLMCSTQKAVEHFACFGKWYAKCTGTGSGAFCMFWCVVQRTGKGSAAFCMFWCGVQNAPDRQWSILHVLVCGRQNAPAKAVENFHVLVCGRQNAPAKAVEHFARFACFGVWSAKCTSKGSGRPWSILHVLVCGRRRQCSILHVLVCRMQNAPANAVDILHAWCVVCKMHRQRQWSISHVLVCGRQNAPAKAMEHFACFGVWYAKCTGKGSGAFCMFSRVVGKMHWQRQWSILHVLACGMQTDRQRQWSILHALVCGRQNALAKAVEHFACFGVW